MFFTTPETAKQRIVDRSISQANFSLNFDDCLDFNEEVDNIEDEETDAAALESVTNIEEEVINLAEQVNLAELVAKQSVMIV